MRRRFAVIGATLSLLCATAARGQQGRADLRYVAPMPASLTFTRVDSLSTTMSGLPIGDMTSTGVVRSVNELRFTPTADGFSVVGTLKEFSGNVSTPYGDMPLDESPGSTIEFTIGAAGAAADMLPDPTTMLGPSPAALVAQSHAGGGLVPLPGRVVTRGETWADTVRMSPTMDGVTVEMVLVHRGSYDGDTVVEGRTLNVLRITSTMESSMSGAMQGREISSRTRSTGEQVLLWDSARHFAVRSDSRSSMTTRMSMAQLGFEATVTARVRSITTGAPGS